MRVAFIEGKKELHFLESFFACLQNEKNKTEKFPAISEDILEIALILLLCAVLFGVLSFLTLKFLEGLIWLIKQIFFMPSIFET